MKSQPLALQLAMLEQTEIDQNGLSRCLRGQLVHEPDITRSELPFPRRLASGELGSLVIAPLVVESTVFGVVVARVAERASSPAATANSCGSARRARRLASASG